MPEGRRWPGSRRRPIECCWLFVVRSQFGLPEIQASITGWKPAVLWLSMSLRGHGDRLEAGATLVIQNSALSTLPILRTQSGSSVQVSVFPEMPT